MSIEIAAVGAGIVASLVGATISFVLKERIDKRSEEGKKLLSENAKRRITEIGLNIAGISFSHRIDQKPSEENIKVTDELIKQIEEGIVARIYSEGQLTDENLQAEVDTVVSELKERLENIESRFPDDSSIDKISSINDALFAERIEQLANRLTNLENNQLTKWDVATVVSLIVAGIFTVVGATYAVLGTLGVLAS